MLPANTLVGLAPPVQHHPLALTASTQPVLQGKALKQAQSPRTKLFSS